jgi:aspartate aminotransferase
VNTPSNPTGAVHNPDTINAIVEIAEDHGLFIFSDEVYDEIIYEKEHFSYLGKYDKVIYVNSFSKTFCMTGWRLGYIAASKELLQLLRKFHFNTVACVNTPIQHAAIATLQSSEDHIKKILSAFRFRRNLITRGILSIEGFDCIEPKGGFYAFPSFDFEITSEQLADKLLESGLVCVPGTAFGQCGEGHLRFTFANSKENIMKGVHILEEVATTLQ